MIKRVRWTDEERQSVLEKAVEVLHRDPTCSSLDALRSAQNLMLPNHRLRAMATHSAVLPEIKQLKAMALNAPITKKVETPKVVEPVQPEPPDSPELPALSNASMDMLIAEIAKRIAGQLSQAIATEVKELEHYFKVEKHKPTYEAAGIFKKRVVVVGLLQDQEHAIEREFGDKFAFKFIGTDAARHADVPQANAYLLMKNFISHTVFHKYQNLPGYVLIDGGMSTLRMWLNTKGAEL